jgi:hypothetical protein
VPGALAAGSSRDWGSDGFTRGIGHVQIVIGVLIIVTGVVLAIVAFYL